MIFGDPRNLLILLGFICQGYSWENLTAPAILLVGWWFCLKLNQKKPRLSQGLEAAILIASFIGFKLLSSSLGSGHTNFMFLGGNVLLVYQAIHLMGPADRRQQRTSIIVAIMHIGVGTQFIFDYKAFAIVLAALALIPRAFHAVDSEYFAGDSPVKYSRSNVLELSSLVCLAVIFFLGFPRFRLQTHPAGKVLNSQRGPLSEEVDMAEGGGPGGEQLVFQVEGQDIGYLKCFALDKFNGVKWSASRWMMKIARNFSRDEIDSAQTRSVRVFYFRGLRNCLPVDGSVQNLQSNYPDRPFIAGDGAVKVEFRLRNELSYIYWTKQNAHEKPLGKKEKARYLEVPPQSQRLIEWLDAIIGEETSPDIQAEKLANHFRSEFSYKIGAPDLSRINPMDEFIFDHKEGHCERFASALAVLLRLKGIPSRVGVGFLPVENNELGDFYNIRLRHAHAWTEAYFQGKGWRIVDATPNGLSVQLERRPLAFTFLEWIEYVWYSKVVEFSVYEQRAFFNFAAGKVKEVMAYSVGIFRIILGFLGSIFFVFVVYKLIRRNSDFFAKRVSIPQKNLKAVKHFYTRMIRALARQNYIKRGHQTPIEFLDLIERNQHPLAGEIRLVTNCFCEIYYGQIELSSETLGQLKTALEKIVKSKR